MYSIKMRSSQQSKHISGAETICDEPAIADVLLRFLTRAFITKMALLISLI